MTASDFNLTESQFTELRDWVKFNVRVKKFCNNSNLDTFKEIFGDSEGERLFRHFRFNCNHNFIEFMTYLTNGDNNKILPYIARNYEL